MLTLDNGEKKTILRRRDENRQPWLTKKDAQKAVRTALGKAEKGEWIDPSKQTVGEYLDTWAAGLRLAATSGTSVYTSSRTSAAWRWQC
ncbi:hypothetical protein [Nonomuraea gerenzanensis]|uniref:Uncharacterized protein n=1 Tax=Nonomuraea gerenzanensis TaxID=93944 RepID=A0A1M4EF94_9ACTN|nr:hypothetical protein [Nonomuraea gerenzanensis]UBU09167.1 hypothetical protein LCN96_32905 [Nonomuraea gerenzanensis]SBO97559.1 hypothetical protein BN4615_P7075 [Nonomuraea gerenzanensis]